MWIDFTAGKPPPDGTENLYRFTEEERRAVFVIEKNGLDQARRSKDMSDREDRDKQRDLPEPDGDFFHGLIAVLDFSIVENRRSRTPSMFSAMSLLQKRSTRKPLACSQLVRIWS